MASLLGSSNVKSSTITESSAWQCCSRKMQLCVLWLCPGPHCLVHLGFSDPSWGREEGHAAASFFCASEARSSAAGPWRQGEGTVWGVLSSVRQSGGRESRISLKMDRCRVKSSCVCQTPVKQEGEKTAISTFPRGWEWALRWRRHSLQRLGQDR